MKLLSRFPGVLIVGSLQAMKQSCSTRKGLCLGTGFVDFRQIWEVRVFSYSVIFGF